MQPKLSVLVTGRNCEAYVGACLESVRAQTFQEWECLVYSDDSDDETMDYVWPYLGRDDRFHATDGGGMDEDGRHCRNTALPNLLYLITEARAPIVLILDMDDLLSDPECFARIMALYDADPELDCTYGSYMQDSGALGHCQEVPADAGRFDGWFYGHPLTWRRELSLRSFREEPEAYIDPRIGKPWQITYDLALFFPVLYRARKVRFVPEVSYVYRRHADCDDMHDLAGQQQAATMITQYWQTKEKLGS